MEEVQVPRIEPPAEKNKSALRPAVSRVSFGAVINPGDDLLLDMHPDASSRSSKLPSLSEVLAAAVGGQSFGNQEVCTDMDTDRTSSVRGNIPEAPPSRRESMDSERVPFWRQPASRDSQQAGPASRTSNDGEAFDTCNDDDIFSTKLPVFEHLLDQEQDADNAAEEDMVFGQEDYGIEDEVEFDGEVEDVTILEKEEVGGSEVGFQLEKPISTQELAEVARMPRCTESSESKDSVDLLDLDSSIQGNTMIEKSEQAVLQDLLDMSNDLDRPARKLGDASPSSPKMMPPAPFDIATCSEEISTATDQDAGLPLSAASSAADQADAPVDPTACSGDGLSATGQVVHTSSSPENSSAVPADEDILVDGVKDQDRSATELHDMTRHVSDSAINDGTFPDTAQESNKRFEFDF